IREIVNEIEKSIKKINKVETGVAIERTLSKIEKIINYVTVAKICIRQKIEGFDKIVHLRKIYLIRNQKNSDNIHEPFINLENQSQPNQSYRRID
ncbi:4872_t:CDS:2, partial [Funneliformis geosporum]